MMKYFAIALMLLLAACAENPTAGTIAWTPERGAGPAAWDARYPLMAAGGAAEIHFTRPGTVRDGGEDPEADDAIIALLDGAQDRVILCLFEFDRAPIVEAAVRAAARGVEVYFAGDGDELHDTGYERLVEAGVTLALRSPGDRIMHNKFVVIDDRWVATGSMNFSENGLLRNNNNLIVMDSPELGAVYSAEFAQMYDQGLFGRKKVTVPDDRNIVVGDALTEIYFSPRDDVAQKLVQTLDTADHAVYFAIFSFTHADVVAKLIELHQRGVRVVGIFDESQANGRYSVDEQMAAAGVPVFIDGNKNAIGFAGGKLHHKIAIIDPGTDSEPLVVTGSFNWSNAATHYNDENLAVLHGDDFATAFVEEFCGMLESATPHPGLATPPEDACAELFSPAAINEIQANPAGTDTDEEYLEIVNSGKRELDLTGWTIADSYKLRHVFDEVILVPGGAVTVYSGPAVGQERIEASTGALGLNNNADEVFLRDARGKVVNAVAYKSAISGTSFVRAGDDGTGELVPHTDLGSPASPGTRADGSPWKVYVPPLIINEFLADPDGTDTPNEFVEVVNAGTRAVDLAGWTLADGIKIRHTFGPALLAPGEAMVVYGGGVRDSAQVATGGTLSLNNTGDTLTLADPKGRAADIATWTGAKVETGVSLNRASDGADDEDFVLHGSLPGAFATMSPGTRADGNPWIGAPLGQLVINEVMPDPDGSDRGGEFVEIINIGTASVNLDGFTLGDAANGARHTFDGTILLPGQVTVVYDSGQHDTIPGAIVASSGALSLNNTEETVTLQDRDQVLDIVHYLSAPSGESLNRALDGSPDAKLEPHGSTAGAQGALSPGTRNSGASWQ